MLMNDISPMRVGQTDPAAVWNFLDANNKVIPMPVGTTFTLYIYDPHSNITKLGTGTFDATNIATGIATYNWNAADTATEGEYEVFVGYVKPGGAQGYTDPVEWMVVPIFTQI